MCLRLGILVLLGTLCLTCPGNAQSGRCVGSADLPSTPVHGAKINIIGVEFQGENPLSDAQREQLVKHIQQQDLWTNPEEPDSSWVDQALELLRNVVLLELGYFRANVEATPYLILAQANERQYVLRIAIESGPKYRLGTIRFASASDVPLIFTESSLRGQIHLQEGEPLNVSKIRDGLEAIGKMYGSRGYIDATSEPVETIDEKTSRIDLLIKLDQQQSYRIAKTRFRGLDVGAQNDHKLPQEIGDIFNPALWENFFKENKPRFSPDASPDRNIRTVRNTKDATLEVILDFRPCTEPQPLED